LVKNVLEEYIEYENKHSNEFLENMKMKKNRFSKEEYNLFEPIFKNNIIEKICNVIKNLIKEQKLSEEAEFMILGDFLFSMTSCDLRDPSNIIFKTSRNDYLDKIVLRCNINEYFKYSWYNSFVYLETHKKLLIGMTLEKILKKKIIKKNKNGSWESRVYYSIEVPELGKKHIGFLGICNQPFVIRKILNSSYSVGSFRSIWKIKRKKREMENKNMSYSGVDKMNKICYIIPKKNYLISEKVIENEKNRLLKESNCISFDEYMKKTVEAIKENTRLAILLYKGNKDDDINLWKIKYEKNKEVILLLKNFQKIIGINIVEKDIFDKNTYLPCFIDNRGRQYYGTLLSPTFNKVLRYMYEFKKKKKFKKLEKSNFYKNIMSYAKEISDLKLKGKNVYIAIILFIEIGKFFIKNNNYMIKTEEIIKIGRIKYMNRDNKVDFEDLIYLNKIYEKLSDLLNHKKINSNMILFKDATASGLQNYGIVAGYKKDMLKYLNLNGKDWCDTYQYIVNKFIKDEKYKKRKYWKSTIMTIPYNAVWFSCFRGFISAIKKDNIKYSEMSDNEKKYIKKMHKEFYENVKNNVKEEFYEKNERIIENNIIRYSRIENKIVECITIECIITEKIENRIMECKVIECRIIENIENKVIEWKIIECSIIEESEIKFIECNIIQKINVEFIYMDWIAVGMREYKINFKKIRDKYRDIVYVKIYDKKASETAKEANIMHYLDALLIREILKEFDVLGVHDCFGVRLSELHLVMDKINNYYSKIIGENTYSIHVII